MNMLQFMLRKYIFAYDVILITVGLTTNNTFSDDSTTTPTIKCRVDILNSLRNFRIRPFTAIHAYPTIHSTKKNCQERASIALLMVDLI